MLDTNIQLVKFPAYKGGIASAEEMALIKLMNDARYEMESVWSERYIDPDNGEIEKFCRMAQTRAQAAYDLLAAQHKFFRSFEMTDIAEPLWQLLVRHAEAVSETYRSNGLAEIYAAYLYVAHFIATGECVPMLADAEAMAKYGKIG